MRRKKHRPISKARREYFGGVIFRERPAFVAYVNEAYAQAYNIPATQGAIVHEGVFTAPLDAHLALTTRCNLFCTGCYNIREGDAPQDISIETAKAVIDRLAALSVLSLSFGGGEPTLHPAMFEIAAYAREKLILPNMTTNGLTMTEQFAEKCSVFGNIHFSIHSLQDMNHIFSSIQTYRKATGNKPGLNLLLTTETLPHLEDIIYKAKKSGVHKILFLRYKTTAKNEHIQGLCADEALVDLPIRLKELQRKNMRVMFLFDCSLFEVLAEQNFLDIDTFRKYDNRGCWGGNSYIAIDINGMYKPCSFWKESYGNVLDLSFDNWIHNSKLNEFRSMRRDESCVCCDYEELCLGGCRLLHNKI